MVTTLMQPTVSIVLNIGKWLSETENAQSRSLSTRALHDEIIASIRHTATEKHQLLRLLQQHHALAGVLPQTSQLLNKADAPQLLKALRTANTNLPLVYGDAN
jgi:2-oxo-4-hydroxy-4-carboxy--5-ureidoimidazoline (OHCU) decarboxylase